MTDRQKLCIVVICALWIRVACCFRCSLSGYSINFFSIASRILSFISAAAASVNVTIRSLSTSTGGSSLVSIVIIRSTSTAVFPEPAAADTRIFRFLKSMTFCCSCVHVTPIFYAPPFISSDSVSRLIAASASSFPTLPISRYSYPGTFISNPQMCRYGQ